MPLPAHIEMLFDAMILTPVRQLDSETLLDVQTYLNERIDKELARREIEGNGRALPKP